MFSEGGSSTTSCFLDGAEEDFRPEEPSALQSRAGGGVGVDSDLGADLP